MKSRPSALAARLGSAAFSLVELLVATTVAMLLLTMLMTLFSGTLQSWSTTAARNETFSEARASLHLLERELNNLAPKIETPGTTIPQVFTGMKAPGGATDQALGFFCKVPQQTQPSASASSDICGVTYFLAPESAQPHAPLALFRRLISSGQTFAMLEGAPNLFFQNACVADGQAEVVAANVISFKVRLRNQELQPVALPATVTTPTDAAFVEIALKVISSSSAQTYFHSTTSAAQKDKISLQEAREFTLRHALR